MIYICFFFNDTATTEIYTLSLHDALPIFERIMAWIRRDLADLGVTFDRWYTEQSLYEGSLFETAMRLRSEEHTSELQSRQYLVCRLLLEKKKKLFPPLPLSISLISLICLF